jgi:hypothetical protein
MALGNIDNTATLPFLHYNEGERFGCYGENSMIRKYSLFLIFAAALIWLALPESLKAANIHIRYFESADAYLTDKSFQIFSFSALEGEKVTIVAYGLDEGVIPAMTLLDTEGRTMQESLNPEGRQAVVIETTIPVNGIYTFVVNRTSEVGGLIRVMVFEGDPVADSSSLLDTVDPFLPSRAYLLAGSETKPVKITISVQEVNSGDVPELFVSRGTRETPPPLEERVNPIRDVVTWTNDRGDTFYTFNVRATPEPLGSAFRSRDVASYRRQTTGLPTIRLDVNEGSETPEFIFRSRCAAITRGSIPWLAGPGGEYAVLGMLGKSAVLQIVGEQGDYFQIVQPDSPTGGGWVLKSDLNLNGNIGDCQRVEDVPAPTLTDENNFLNSVSGGGLPEASEAEDDREVVAWYLDYDGTLVEILDDDSTRVTDPVGNVEEYPPGAETDDQGNPLWHEEWQEQIEEESSNEIGDDAAEDGGEDDGLGDGLPGDDDIGDGLPGDDGIGDGLPGDDSIGDGLPGDDGIGDGLPGDDGIGDGLPGDDGIGDGLPGDDSIGDGLPGDDSIGDGLPGDDGIGDGPPVDDGGGYDDSSSGYGEGGYDDSSSGYDDSGG